MTNPRIVPIVDQSGSMGSFGYLAPAKTDAATFVNIMNTGDALAVVAFSDNATTIWPASGTLQVIQSQADQVAATQAIEALTSLNMTNMSAAVYSGLHLLAAPGAPRGIVLLSDGMWNVGTDPTSGLDKTVPIHTIALGPNGEQAVLQSIASLTGGSYHYTPSPLGLAQIYNEIVNRLQVAAVLANAQEPVGSYKFKQTFGTVEPGMAQASFSVNWDNTAVTYTSGTPVGEQVNVTVYDPDGQPVAATPIYDGDAFVVFKIPNPAAGAWSAVSWYSGSGTLNTTAGIFQPETASQVLVHVDNDAARSGGPAPFTVHTRGLDAPTVTAAVEAPAASLGELLETHADALGAVTLPEPVAAGAADEPVARLHALHAADPTIVPPTRDYPVTLHRVADDVYEGQIADTSVPGSYTVHVRAQGRSSTSGHSIERRSRASCAVPAPSQR